MQQCAGDVIDQPLTALWTVAGTGGGGQQAVTTGQASALPATWSPAAILLHTAGRAPAPIHKFRHQVILVF